MRLLRWLPVGLWLVVICFLSFSSLEEIPLPSFFGWDKLGHFGMYFLLEFLILFALDFKERGVLFLSLIAFVFSALTEVIQHYLIVNRYGEVSDLLANSIGILFAYLLIKMSVIKLNKA